MAEYLVCGRRFNPRRHHETDMEVYIEGTKTFHFVPSVELDLEYRRTGERNNSPEKQPQNKGSDNSETASRFRALWGRLRGRSKRVTVDEVISADPKLKEHIDRYNRIAPVLGSAPIQRSDLVDLLERN